MLAKFHADQAPKHIQQLPSATGQKLELVDAVVKDLKGQKPIIHTQKRTPPKTGVAHATHQFQGAFGLKQQLFFVHWLILQEHDKVNRQVGDLSFMTDHSLV